MAILHKKLIWDPDKTNNLWPFFYTNAWFCWLKFHTK
jgi:hypothetical protein